MPSQGSQWLSGRVLDSRPRGRGLEPHRRHCVVSLSKNINHSLVLVQHRKTRPFITERLLMGSKESKQTNKTYAISVNIQCRATVLSAHQRNAIRMAFRWRADSGPIFTFLLGFSHLTFSA